MSKLIKKANAIITNHHFDKVQDPKPLYINDLNLPKNVTFTHFRGTLTLYDHKGNPYGTIYRYTKEDIPISTDTSLYVKYLLLIDNNGNETLIYYDLKGKKRFLLTEGTLTIYNDYALPKTIQERKPYDKS
jgi:hypothetical protein